MAGLMDSMAPQDWLQLAGGLLSRNPDIGQALLGTLAGQQRRMGLQQQQELMAMQIEQQRKALADQAAQRELAAKFSTPGQPNFSEQGPQIPQAPGFDYKGYANARAMTNPAEAQQILAGIVKDNPYVHVKEGESVLQQTPGGGLTPVYTGPQKMPESVQAFQFALSARGIKPGTPQYEQAMSDFVAKTSGGLGPAEAQRLAMDRARLGMEAGKFTYETGLPAPSGGPRLGGGNTPTNVTAGPQSAPPLPQKVQNEIAVKLAGQQAPASIMEKLATNNVALQKVDQALEGIAKYPSGLGVQNMLGDAINQRMDPKGVKIRALISSIAGQKFHDLSGAAVSVQEADRLKPFIPGVNDMPEAARQKLLLFKNEYSMMQNELAQGRSAADVSKRAVSGQSPADPLGIR